MCVCRNIDQKNKHAILNKVCAGGNTGDFQISMPALLFGTRE